MQNALRGEYENVATNCISILCSVTSSNHGAIIKQPKMPIHLRKTNIFFHCGFQQFWIHKQTCHWSIAFGAWAACLKLFFLWFACMCLCLCASSLVDVRSNPAFAPEGMAWSLGKAVRHLEFTGSDSDDFSVLV